MLKNQFNFSADAVTVTQVLANLGAMLGGTLCGWAAHYVAGPARFSAADSLLFS